MAETLIAKTEVYETISFYKDLIEKIKKEDLNPFDLSIQELKGFVGDNIFTNSLIISILSKLLKLKAEYLANNYFPKDEEEREKAVKSIFKQAIKDETGMEEDDIEALLMVESIKEKLRKPKAVNPVKISYQEFQEITKNQIKEVLHEDTDYNAYALEIAKKIEEGSFKIRSYRDFIGLMFAIYNFNLDITDISKFI
jgi:hypothetical protein